MQTLMPNGLGRCGYIVRRYTDHSTCLSRMLLASTTRSINRYSTKTSQEPKFTPSQVYHDMFDNITGEQMRDMLSTSNAQMAPYKQKNTNQSNLSFVDKIRIKVKAGDGGSGCVSFHREKYIPEGPPDGGNGGDGANIILRADFNDNNLSHISRNYIGQNGEKGKGARRTGKSGEDIIIRVPVGTVIREMETYFDDDGDAVEREDKRLDSSSDEFDPDYYLSKLNSPVIDGKTDTTLFEDQLSEEYDMDQSKRRKKLWREVQVVADFDTPGQELVFLRGGRGGRGNYNFASSTNRSPDYAGVGRAGHEKYLDLELKIIADIGLVGYPNAGKSTLLSRMSNAVPKIKNYAFTTLRPYVGVVDLGVPEEKKPMLLSKRPRRSVTDHNNTTTMADLPGILEGAHLNVGLGLDFLRHIERTKVLCYVIDMSNEGVPAIWDGTTLEVVPDRYKDMGDDEESIKMITDSIRSKAREMDQRAPWTDYVTLVEELETYQPGLSKKPSLIIANKMDQPYAEDHLEEFKRAVGHLINCPIIPVSAEMDDPADFNKVRKVLKDLVKNIKPQEGMVAQPQSLSE
ncbi:hypothetical protein SAMD00019534_035010, partial [Acytostelium subglobosum LB1]|uniref:hypothetical protein n=1 Tax=Acytostelium subglobosum LB1 TaxID=1410327 RepID=UPI000644F49C